MMPATRVPTNLRTRGVPLLIVLPQDPSITSLGTLSQ
ncbi:Uncharacterised protein [Mycobacteroides abscessus subsp. abscessus]|nr:Uncharacterised protein [Mycobacteroides abscessus subsp. abscessus]